MIPSLEAIDIAVLRIFRDNQVYEEGRLSMVDLEEQWAKIRLRGSDLGDALIRLAEDASLRMERDGGEVFVKLLRKGARHISSLPVGMQFLQRGLQAIELAIVDRRQPLDPKVRRNRRETDRPESSPQGRSRSG